MAYIDFRELQALEETIKHYPALSWESAGHSDVGKVRSVNEDAFFLSHEQGLWAVADGMGGFARGDYASGVVVDALAYFNRLDSVAESIRDLEMRLIEAHNRCRSTFAEEKIGSTVVSFLTYGNYCMILWAGDSRVYRLRNKQLKQMTKDHTLAQLKYERGELSASQAVMHPTSDILTKAIGVHQNLGLDLEFQVVEPGDRYLLCSDGLYNDVRRRSIYQILEQGTPQAAVESLVTAALENGGRDNISAIVLDANYSG